MKIVRHIPDVLAKVNDGLRSEWKDLQVVNKVDGKSRVPSENYGGEIEIPEFIFCMEQS